MSVDSGEPAEETRAVCRNKECRHILTRQFVNYRWVVGTCPNPDCFYHTHSQEERPEEWPHPW